ncbi:MAG TPA: hypothetical protein VGQ69_09780 [Gemmatimonadales bacterium]|jgi:hypothetical protein|nr:hypothetical protein [Gemmatimonadales bacterium]
MITTLSLRKFALTAHVTFSVGWLGAVAGFLALALAGLTSQDVQLARAAYLAMDLTAWFVIVPLSLLTLPTGLVMALGTEWGLFRHYWILAKLVITVLATLLLLVHLQPVGHLAAVVAARTLARGELAGLRLQLVADSGAALVALLATTALSVYKPRGLTPFGRRESIPRTSEDRQGGPYRPRWVKTLGIIAVALFLLFVILHLTGGGLHGH